MERRVGIIEQEVKVHDSQLDVLETDSLLMKEHHNVLNSKFETLKNSIQKSFTMQVFEIGVATIIILFIIHILYNIINSTTTK